jgi:hypothetical protein
MSNIPTHEWLGRNIVTAAISGLVGMLVSGLTMWLSLHGAVSQTQERVSVVEAHQADEKEQLNRIERDVRLILTVHAGKGDVP